MSGLTFSETGGRKSTSETTRFAGTFESLTMILYLSPPITLVSIVSNGNDPVYYIVMYLMSFPHFNSFVKNCWLPGFGKVFQIIFIILTAWPTCNFLMYEGVRIFVFFISAATNLGAKATSILQKLIEIGPNQGQKRFQYYNRFRIISQSVENAVKLSVVLILAAVGVMLCGFAFLLVRLYGRGSHLMFVINGFTVILSVLILELLLTMFGKCDALCRIFFRCCKNERHLVGKSGCRRTVYRKKVRSLRLLILPVGLGQFSLSRITKDSKSSILFYLVEIIGNVLIAF